MLDIVNSIKISKLFNNISTNEINEILKDLKYKEINFKKGDCIFNTHSNANQVGIVISGKLNVEKLLPCGKSILMYEKISGDILGEVAVFSDTDFYPCNTIAMIDGKILILDKINFFNLIYSNKEVLKNFLNLICNKAYYLNNHIGSLSYTSAKQKVAQSLLSFANVENTNKIKLPYSKRVWSDRINISRASLYRELESLCGDSIISLEKKGLISILNKEELEAITLN